MKTKKSELTVKILKKKTPDSTLWMLFYLSTRMFLFYLFQWLEHDCWDRHTQTALQCEEYKCVFVLVASLACYANIFWISNSIPLDVKITSWRTVRSYTHIHTYTFEHDHQPIQTKYTLIQEQELPTLIISSLWYTKYKTHKK